MMNNLRLICLSVFLVVWTLSGACQQMPEKPNIVLIYVDDLGYGDLGSYGAVQITTPHLDRLAEQGVRFTNGYSTSATCTPSRYALMTGTYPWRRQGTDILPGDAALIVPQDKTTIATVLRDAGYKTGVIGKWHLGLGESVDKNWNNAIMPGPLEVGFDYSFIFPATADRVPTVFIENHQVVGLEHDDPIHVSYTEKIGDEPTGKENPELLKMPSSPNHGHDNTIINGIGRIGFMEGGKKARWVDEELSLTFLSKAKSFIKENKSDPFFLFFALTEPHVPRMPATMFKGQSKLGYRGDAIKQMDWTVGEIIGELEKLKLDDNTVVIFTSDNGPVLDDGYVDGAVEQLNGHKPAGELRGGKYSIFEAGTRMPWIVWGKGVEKNKVSEALISQVDLLASLAELVDSAHPKEARDSKAMSRVLLGTADEGREYVIQHAGTLAIRKGDWKYIAPSNGRAYNKLTDIELGNLPEAQLYNLSEDPGETRNLADQYPEIVRELKSLLEKEKND